jgi:hypothetical protein
MATLFARERIQEDRDEEDTGRVVCFTRLGCYRVDTGSGGAHFTIL